jgi:hypothetical protein
MHRLVTPKRLPAWANEGYADFLASVIFRRTREDAERRALGLKYIREGGNVNALLDMTYDDDAWPGPGGVLYPIGALMIELMQRDKPKQFNAWVRAVKAGKDWEQALTEDFGVPRAQLVTTFVQYYMVND